MTFFDTIDDIHIAHCSHFIRIPHANLGSNIYYFQHRSLPQMNRFTWHRVPCNANNTDAKEHVWRIFLLLLPKIAVIIHKKYFMKCDIIFWILCALHKKKRNKIHKSLCEMWQVSNQRSIPFESKMGNEMSHEGRIERHKCDAIGFGCCGDRQTSPNFYYVPKIFWAFSEEFFFHQKWFTKNKEINIGGYLLSSSQHLRAIPVNFWRGKKKLGKDDLKATFNNFSLQKNSVWIHRRNTIIEDKRAQYWMRGACN